MTSDFLSTTGVTIVCFVYTILIFILYILKDKSKRTPQRIFFILLVVSIISMILYIITGYFSTNKIPGGIFLARILCFTIIEWEYILIYYLALAVTNAEEDKTYLTIYNKIINIIIIVGSIINLILSFILSVEFNQIRPGLPYTIGGNLILYINILGIVSMVTTFISFMIYRKRLKKIDFVLCFMSIGYCIISFLLESFIHEPVNDIPFTQAIVLIFLYLSLESQDANLVLEYSESNRKAKESNELKSEFIMNMSHQLRTPMNTILGFSDSLLTDEDGTLEQVKEDATNIKIASRKLLDLVNSILDISKLESNKEVLNNKDYSLDTIIYDLSSNINSKIDKENLVFTINANENCPNNLNGDDYKLSKILNILLSNAVKYTNYGEVSLNVSSKMIDNQNHEFTFHIKNTGHAMKTENFERSFEDLIKLNSNSNNDIDADTLKIIVAKGLLKIINGTVEFINEPGQGTQYIVKVIQKVVSPGELGNVREKIQTKHAITYQEINLLNKKILVIDDETINSIIIQRQLKKYNANIETTSNPRDGVEKASNEKYDIIFVNHHMEDMSGEEVIKKLESTGNKVPPVIGIMISSDESNENNIYSDTLYSPIEFRELNKIIKKYLDN